MTWHRFSPAVLTLLVFLLAQGVGGALLILFGIQPIMLLSFIIMAVDVLAVLLCYLLLRNIHFSTARDVSHISWRSGILAIIGGILGAMSISILTQGVELPEMMQQLSLAMSRSVWGLLAMTIVGPVTEELLFREAIEGEMLRRGASPWTAIFISALAFSAVHLNLAQGLYAFPLGIMFGIIYYKTESVVLTSLLHILNNSIVVVLLYTMGEDAVDATPAELFGSDRMAWTFMAFSGVLSIMLIKLFWDSTSLEKKEAKNDPY